MAVSAGGRRQAEHDPANEHRAQEFRCAVEGDGEAREFVVEFPGGSGGEQGYLDNILRSTDEAVVAEVVIQERGEIASHWSTSIR